MTSEINDTVKILIVAIGKIADEWGLHDEGLSATLAANAIDLERLQTSERRMVTKTEPVKFAQYFLRLYGSLDGVFAGEGKSAIQWLQTTNLDLGAPPAELIKTIAGLKVVCDYVDAHLSHS